VVSGFTIAIFAVINSELVKRHDAYVITFYEMCGAAISIALFLPIYTGTWSVTGKLELTPTLSDWLWLGILAFVCTVYAYAASIQLMKRLSVFTIQLTLNLEPVYGIVLALLVFQEKEIMSAGFYAGTIIILGAVFAYPAIKRLGNKTG
jgi:drug/metabolite transporter (DMT)-like permease